MTGLIDAELAEIEAYWFDPSAPQDDMSPALRVCRARSDLLRVIAEVRRLRAERDQADGEAAGWQSRYESLLEDKVKAHYDLEAANAEIDRLRVLRCETCADWRRPSLGVWGTCDSTSPYSPGRIHAAPDFGCVCWQARARL